MLNSYAYTVKPFKLECIGRELFVGIESVLDYKVQCSNGNENQCHITQHYRVNGERLDRFHCIYKYLGIKKGEKQSCKNKNTLKTCLWGLLVSNTPTT